MVDAAVASAARSRPPPRRRRRPRGTGHVAPSAATLTAVFAAPPAASSRRSSATTGTGASRAEPLGGALRGSSRASPRRPPRTFRPANGEQVDDRRRSSHWLDGDHGVLAPTVDSSDRPTRRSARMICAARSRSSTAKSGRRYWVQPVRGPRLGRSGPSGSRRDGPPRRRRGCRRRTRRRRATAVFAARREDQTRLGFAAVADARHTRARHPRGGMRAEVEPVQASAEARENSPRRRPTACERPPR